MDWIKTRDKALKVGRDIPLAQALQLVQSGQATAVIGEPVTPVPDAPRPGKTGGSSGRFRRK